MGSNYSLASCTQLDNVPLLFSTRLQQGSDLIIRDPDQIRELFGFWMMMLIKGVMSTLPFFFKGQNIVLTTNYYKKQRNGEQHKVCAFFSLHCYIWERVCSLLAGILTGSFYLTFGRVEIGSGSIAKVSI